MKELKGLQDSVEQIEKLYSDYEDLSLLIEMSEEDADEETVSGIEEELKQFEDTFEELRIGTLLTGPYDRDNAIVTLHAGAGGTESCDWTNMLYRMYTRWAEKKGYHVEVLDYLEGDVAGIKGVTFEVSGENAYGYLRSEKGVHRLVRISPFNAAGKRQTSFASCDVIRMSGAGARETFTVRKISFSVGVERTFPLHSPKIAKLDVVRHGDVRRAKLYYLRDRVGKAARIREKRD